MHTAHTYAGAMSPFFLTLSLKGYTMFN